MHIGNYLALVSNSEADLANAYHLVAKEHEDEPDVEEECKMQASWSEKIVQELQPFLKNYSKEKNKEPDRLFRTLFEKPRTGSLALLRDLHDLWLIAGETKLSCVLLRQASDALRDKELTALCNKIEKTAKRQQAWLLTRMKAAAPQALIVAE